MCVHGYTCAHINMFTTWIYTYVDIWCTCTRTGTRVCAWVWIRLWIWTHLARLTHIYRYRSDHSTCISTYEQLMYCFWIYMVIYLEVSLVSRCSKHTSVPKENHTLRNLRPVSMQGWMCADYSVSNTMEDFYFMFRTRAVVCVVCVCVLLVLPVHLSFVSYHPGEDTCICPQKKQKKCSWNILQCCSRKCKENTFCAWHKKD